MGNTQCTIADLQDEKYALCNGDDADAVKAHLGNVAERYDSFFVYAKDGDYVEVWGFYGVMPLLHKKAYRLT